MSLAKDLLEKKEKIAVIGLGYVGHPLAVEFGKEGVSVIGLDVKEDLVDELKNKKDRTNEVSSDDIAQAAIGYTTDPRDILEAKVKIITVPTPIDENKKPDLRPVIAAAKTVGSQLKRGDIVILESTVYPGVSEEVMEPILSEVSGLKFPADYAIGYSPERINPGDKVHTIDKVVKVVAGFNDACTEELAEMYEIICKKGVYRAASLKVAEAAKAIENTQRDLNIAIMNELSVIFDKLGVDTHDVLKAAGTKWNFLNFYPGLVGGHCIGVDPYYLTHKAESVGYIPQLITAGRKVNEEVPKRIAQRIIKYLNCARKVPAESKVLFMGVTFKENVPDSRNSKMVDIVNELKSYGMSDIEGSIVLTDPYADAKEFLQKENLILTPFKQVQNEKYNIVVLVNSHKEYLEMDKKVYEGLFKLGAYFIDIKKCRSDLKNSAHYWSL